MKDASRTQDLIDTVTQSTGNPLYLERRSYNTS